MTRKYQDIHVFNSFYISSSCHVFFSVRWDGGSRDYCPTVGWLSLPNATREGWEGAPKYLTAEVERQIAELLTTGKPKPYEYDRDGNKRFENLRYWGDELRDEIIHLCAPTA